MYALRDDPSQLEFLGALTGISLVAGVLARASAGDEAPEEAHD